MHAIRLLKKQHREVETLFDQFERLEESDCKQTLLCHLADLLVVHATIEERFFYPLLRATDADDAMQDAYVEHAQMKRHIEDCLASLDDPGFDGKVAALKSIVLQHVDEEEEQLFPALEHAFAEEALVAVGDDMEAAAADLLDDGAPRNAISAEEHAPA